MKYKNTTFVNILLIYSHYKPGKPFLKGAPFFGNPLQYSVVAVIIQICSINNFKNGLSLLIIFFYNHN